jgi:hypothetical protein
MMKTDCVHEWVKKDGEFICRLCEMNCIDELERIRREEKFTPLEKI